MNVLMICRQLVREGQEEKHPGNWQNEILETCGQKSKERFQRGHPGSLQKEKGSRCQVRKRNDMSTAAPLRCLVALNACSIY